MNVHDTLAATPLFRDVPDLTRQTLTARAITRLVPATVRLLAAGQVNTSLFIILEGAADVHLPGTDGPHVRLTAGECVGELSLIDGKPVSADVVAVTAMVVLELPFEQVWELIDASPIFARNLLRVVAGRVRNDDAALLQASDRRRHYERLSMMDGLTALNNRRWFDTAFPAHLERLRAEGRSAALLMADVDRFKELNDEDGHAAGDALLRRVAGALAEAVRPTDLLARYGGDEFAVLVPDVSGLAATEVAERLCEAVRALDCSGAPPCTISVGVAVAASTEPFASLVRRADAALFRSKGSGRNCVSG